MFTRLDRLAVQMRMRPKEHPEIQEEDRYPETVSIKWLIGFFGFLLSFAALIAIAVS